MMRRVRHVSLCIAVLAASGCAQYYYGERGGVQVRTDVLQTNYEAADRLLQAAPLDPRRSVLVSTNHPVWGGFSRSRLPVAWCSAACR